MVTRGPYEAGLPHRKVWCKWHTEEGRPRDYHLRQMWSINVNGEAHNQNIAVIEK